MAHWVVVTGLRLRGAWAAPVFWWHAIPCFRQAQAAPGCLRAQARTVGDRHHTVTVWESPAAARAYAQSGAHAKAMMVFDRIATGRITGFAATEPPDWDTALARWAADEPAVRAATEARSFSR